MTNLHLNLFLWRNTCYLWLRRTQNIYNWTSNVRKHPHKAILRWKLKVKIKVFHKLKIFLTSCSTREIFIKQRTTEIHLSIHYISLNRYFYIWKDTLNQKFKNKCRRIEKEEMWDKCWSNKLSWKLCKKIYKTISEMKMKLLLTKESVDRWTETMK